MGHPEELYVPLWAVWAGGPVSILVAPGRARWVHLMRQTSSVSDRYELGICVLQVSRRGRRTRLLVVTVWSHSRGSNDVSSVRLN